MMTRSPSMGLNILKLLSGKIAGQVLGLLTIPIITRIFLPEHFGVLQIFDSISRILVVLACLKYEMSIPLGRNDQEAAASFSLSVLIASITTMMVLAGVSVGRTHVAVWFKASELKTFLWLLPIIVFASGITNALGFWAIRKGQFGKLALSDLGNILVERLTLLSWGFFMEVSATGLFVGRLLGIVVGGSLLLVFLRNTLAPEIQHANLTLDTLLIVVKRHKKFPLFHSWTVFLNSLSSQLPPLILGAYFAPTVVGYYGLGFRTITFPMTMLRDSIAKVFFHATAKEYRESGTLNNTVSTLFVRLVQIGIFPMLVVSFFGPVLFAHVFGRQWAEAGVYAQMLSVWYALAFVSAPLNVFIILNRHELSLFMNIAVLIARAMSLFIGAMSGSPRMTLGIFAVVSACIPPISILWQLKLAHISRWWGVQMIGRYVAISCALLFPIRFFIGDTENSFMLLGALCLVTLSYGGIVFKLDPSFRQFLHEIGIK